MRRLVASSIGIFLVLTAAAGAPNPTPDKDLFSLVEGTWGWDDPKKGGACKTNPEVISISADKKQATFKKSKPSKNLGTGRTETEWEYAILYAEGNKLTMLMKDEIRRTDTGSRVIWVLTLKNSNTYTWSRTDLKETWGNVVRCVPRS